jgi:hypothetical protein
MKELKKKVHLIIVLHFNKSYSPDRHRKLYTDTWEGFQEEVVMKHIKPQSHCCPAGLSKATKTSKSIEYLLN